MSEENEGLTEIVANFTNDVQKCTDLLKTLANYEEKIQIHINKLKKFDEFQAVADIALEVSAECTAFFKATKSIEKNLNKLNEVSKLKKSTKNNETTIENDKISEKESNNQFVEQIDHGQEKKSDPDITVNSVVTSSENERTSEKEQNTKLITELKEKAEAEKENEAADTTVSNGIDKAKQGTIRVVPLQNLLSTSGPKSRNSPFFQFTISDSDDGDLAYTTSTFGHKKLKQRQNFEISDSDQEPTQQLLKVRNENKTSQEAKEKSYISEKPRKKFTSVKTSSEQLCHQVKRKRNSASSDEGIVEPCKTEKISYKFETNHTHFENFVEANFAPDSATFDQQSNTDSCDKNKLPGCSSVSTESSATETIITKPPTIVTNDIKLNHNDFKRECVVRIKRTPLLTSNTTKLDNNTRGSISLSIKVNKKTFKAMSSDSDSDIEILQENNNSNDSNSSSESEIVITRKKRVFRVEKKESSSSSNSESNLKTNTGLATRKKRKILKKSNSSSDDDNGSDNDDKNKNRKKIRKLINEKNLEDDTKRATKEEEERKKRIEERQKMYNQIYVKPECVEIDELILDFDESTKKPLLKVDNGLMKKLKPHQVNGVKFMWDACFETIKDCKEKPGSGCILAHCMGLGKTMQIVTLTHTLLTHYEATHVERVLIISPLSTLNNWAREFHHWISFTQKKDIEVYDMSKYKDKNTRVFKLEEWFTEGGVCIVGYDMYRILSNEKTKGLRKKQKESLQKSLVDPGPDIVVCDEGHLLKNEKTSLSQAVTKIRTKRRIVLTGTPLQNNLKEYYCMIQFIKPNLLGTYKEYLNRFVNPITNGQYTDSTARDIRLMKHRSHILHKMLEACIQRRDYSVLAPYLPPKHEYVVFVTLSEIQKQLYGHYMTAQRELIAEASGNPGKGAKLFQDFQDLRRIWTHPMNLRVNSDTVIRKKLAQYDSDDSIKDFIVDNSDESSTSDSDSCSLVEADTSETKTVRTRNTRAQKGASDNDSDCVEVQQKDDPSEWWTKFVDDTELNNIHHSPKLVLLMTLLQQCEEIGDKVLVFSQSLQSLDVIEHFLSLIDRKTRGEDIEGNVGSFKGYWRPGVNYFRLDGSRTVENRESMCKSFNNLSNLNSRLFLISTRAGGLGINLVAANRVVIFDVSWNPSHDTQSIFRVYRFGQMKPCYIYRLIALGTMELKVYERQVAKQATAKRVIDEQQISRHYNQSDLQELYSYELEPSTPREIPILPKDRLFAELLSKHEKLLFKYHEHDSLLENEDSENLTEEERKAAWDEYEAEKTRPPQPAMQYMSYDRQSFLANYGNPSGSVTSNKIFGFRSDILLRLLNMKGSQDHPELASAQVIQLVPEYLQRLYLEMNNGDPTLYKELLELHKSLEAPGGMYMNPLLFANQTPAPAPAMHPFASPIGLYGQVHPGTSNFNSNEVYEVD